jgi:hypothetical protein
MENLVKIQNELKVPKENVNAFGKYKYRSAEDILEAVKPLLLKYNCTLTLSDEIILVGTKIFVKARAKFSDGTNTEIVNGFAETSEHKGMSAEQTTGTASSYARKYALNGLFLIDETEQDADSQKPKDETKPTVTVKETKLPELTADKFEAMIKAINEGKKLTVEVAMKNYTIKTEYLNGLNIALKNN